MSAHVVLLFDAESASKQTGPSIVNQLERAGYEVVQAHNLSTAAALMYVSRRLEAVIVDAADSRISDELARSVAAIRPGLPLLIADQQVPAGTPGVVAMLEGVWDTRNT